MSLTSIIFLICLIMGVVYFVYLKRKERELIEQVTPITRGEWSERRSYGELYLGKPSQSCHTNGVPLKSCAVRPSIHPAYAGVIHAANRAVLRLFRASYGIIAMLLVVVVSGI